MTAAGSLGKLARAFGVLSLAAAVFSAAARAAEPTAVDLELVLAIDVSRSIDLEEAKLQREGTIAALRDPEIHRAIKSGYLGRIAVAYLDYSSEPFNQVVIGWRVIDGAEAANAFADELAKTELTFGRRTSISSALRLGKEMLDSNDFEGTRRVIDVSGDGPNNFGRLVTIDRDVAVASGITINGLPIINDRDSIGSVFALPDLDKYYQGCVIGGPGAFMVVAKDFKDYARAMRRKLIFEIAGVSPPPNSPRHARARTDGPVPVSFLVPAAANTGYTYERGCDVGERLWQRYWGNQFNDIP